jgi:threonine aldolase
VSALVSFYDTATEPTEAMREAMRTAPVGDDVYGRDPTVRALEERAAVLVGKERAVFLPSGTMANLAAVMAHTRRGDAVVLEARSHIALAETGGVAIVAGCMPLAVTGRNGVLHAADVEACLEPPDQHRPIPTLLCVENTHNRGGGTVTAPETMAGLRAVCERWDLRMHVDGARMFNAAVALDVPPSALAAAADSVCFALSKGLGAPVGSLLAGTEAFVALARRARKLLGGGMRQAGVLAAAGMVALDGWEERLAEDHRRAAGLARRLAGLPGVDVSEPETNIVVCRLRPGAPSAPALVEWLLARGLACSAPAADALRFVVHRQIGDNEVERLADALAEGVPAA